MELTITELKSMPEMLEEELSEMPYMVICVKLNTSDMELFPFFDLNKYLTDNEIVIKYSSYGQHLQGENKRPHVHLNMIVEPFNFKKITQNASQHRKRWYDKNVESEIDAQFLNLTFKFHDHLEKNKPKYSTLSYPLKEGLGIFGKHFTKYAYKNVNKEMYNFLLSVGTDIYNKEVGLHLRQEKCEERKQCALQDLFKMCTDNKSNFRSYKEMALWLDTNYIDKLDINEYPDPKNYKTNLQKIAVKLKLMKYSDMV